MTLVLVLVVQGRVGEVLVLANRELAKARCPVRCDSAHQDCSRRPASGVFATRHRYAPVRAHPWNSPAGRDCPGVVVGATSQQRTSLTR
jgi:hypothetical protein